MQSSSRWEALGSYFDSKGYTIDHRAYFNVAALSMGHQALGSHGRCSQKLDITLSFQELIFSMVPSIMVLIACLIKLERLKNESVKINEQSSANAKLATWTLLGLTQLGLLLAWLFSPTGNCPLPVFAIASATLGVISSCSLAYLSYYHHFRSLRSSGFICLYLLATTVLDATMCYILWSMADLKAPAILCSISVAFKFVLLILESQSKRHILRAEWHAEGPEATSNIFSRSSFWWLNKLMLRGYLDNVSISSFYALDRELRSERLLSRLFVTWRPKEDAAKYAILKPLFAASWHAIRPCFFPRACMIALGLSQPVLINAVINYMDKEGRELSEGIYLIGVTAFLYGGYAIAEANFMHRRFRVETTVRGLFSSLVMNETLDLSSADLGSGVVTILTTDIVRTATAASDLMDIWAGLVEFVIAMWMLFQQLNIGSFGPIMMVIISSGLISIIAKYLPPAQRRWIEATQKRISVTTSIVASMKEVKMLGAVSHWYERIQGLMGIEVGLSLKSRNLVAIMNIVANIPGQWSTVSAFAIAILGTGLGSSDGFSLSKAFTSRAIINLISSPLAMMLYSVPAVVRSLASIERIQIFLNNAHQSRILRGEATDAGSGDKLYTDEDLTPHDSTDNDTVVQVVDGECRFKADADAHLKNVNISIPSKSFTMIVGKVGTGKSVLLSMLLGELQVTGKSKLLGDVAYCAQTPWLFNGTIRENIIGRSAMDDEWYDTVIKACALEQDFTELEKRDQSIIGSKGTTLSGGQKHRIALARAVYSRRKVLVADDVLSGLDWTTQAAIWKQVFGQQGILRQQNRTCILATHCINWIEEADKILFLGGNGTITLQGSYDTLNADEDFVQFMSTRNNTPSSGSSIHEAKSAEPQQAGVTGPAAVSKKDDETKEGPKTYHGDASIYKYYLDHIGWKYAAIALFGGLIGPCFNIMTELWLKHWAEQNESKNSINNKAYLGVYTVLQIIGACGFNFDVWLFMVLISAVSLREIHTSLFNVLMKARLSYFSKTDTGDTINRFSTDLGFMSIQLPYYLMVTWITFRGVIVGSILIIPGSTYLIASVPFSLLFIYVLQKFYLPTSRQLRYHSLQSAAPMNSHILEALDGLATIRAYGWTEHYRDVGLLLLDESQKPTYMLICVQRWLGLVLDAWVAAMAVLVVSLGVFFPETTTKGFMAIALVGVVALGSQLSNLVSAWTNLETALGALNRVREFEHTTPEEPQPEHPQDRPNHWPENGEMELENVTAAYSLEPTSPPVINDVSISIRSGQKVAICGRTGSGKSSLLLTLFRMLDSFSGRIVLDGIDTANFTPDQVRERLNAVPQEATVFPGSVRDNLWQGVEADGAGPSDEEMEAALEQVELWTYISGQGGLDKEATELSLSQGQKQLVCLARAVLRKRKSNVLVLDEAMSAVDGNTEQVMVRILETEFSEHTVVSVAHRLNTVRKFDVVVVMDRGRVAESGNPDELLKNKSGKFYSMWNSNGQ